MHLALKTDIILCTCFHASCTTTLIRPIIHKTSKLINGIKSAGQTKGHKNRDLNHQRQVKKQIVQQEICRTHEKERQLSPTTDRKAYFRFCFLLVIVGDGLLSFEVCHLILL